MRDELTGLANSGAFHQYLNTALSNAIKVKEYEVGVIYVGVDGLKLVNSGLGRNAGDQLLIDISRRLHLAVRDRVAEGGTIATGFGLVYRPIDTIVPAKFI